MTEPAARERIGPYVVEAPLGRGSMGTVYLARDQRIGRRVALKQLNAGKAQFEDSSEAAEFQLRLQREAEVCGALQHPNIVTLYDVGYDGDRISYLALEYVAGETLLDLLKRHRPRPLPIEAALRITADVLQGLAYAHAKGIVHRDIKPANILIGEDGIAKIADFGIARPPQSSMTVAGALMGTPNYMSPEQVRSTPATPRSDLFSLGILLFEMVTGTKPFAGTDLTSTLEKIVRAPTPAATALNAEVSPELEAVIQRLTSKEPQERFASAADALAEIERLRTPGAGEPETTIPDVGDATQRLVETETPDTAQSPLRRRIPAGIFFAVVATLAILAAVPGIAIWRATDPEPAVRIGPAQLAEFEQKREALRAAEELLQAGKYAESAQAYDAYLARYPYSTVARDGAERARAALAAQNEREAAPRAKNQPPKKDPTLMQDIKRSVKRLFGRG